MEMDFDKGVFIKTENEHIFKYFEKFSYKLEKISENC